jgi:hypothetical protein
MVERKESKKLETQKEEEEKDKDKKQEDKITIEKGQEASKNNSDNSSLVNREKRHRSSRAASTIHTAPTSRRKVSGDVEPEKLNIPTTATIKSSPLKSEPNSVQVLIRTKKVMIMMYSRYHHEKKG